MGYIMEIGIYQWRSVVRQCPETEHNPTRPAFCKEQESEEATDHYTLLLIRLLLMRGCVEPNPGPTFSMFQQDDIYQTSSEDDKQKLTLNSDSDDMPHDSNSEDEEAQVAPKRTSDRQVKLLQNFCKFLYPKRPVDMSGALYEIKVAALLFVRGLHLNMTFYLAANMDEAAAFDDIIFRYKGLNPNEEIVTCFLQLKHKKKDGKKAIINSSDILSVGGDFCLPKYCSSYNEVKKKFSSNSEHLIFKESLDSCTFAIYTNASRNKSLPGKVSDSNSLGPANILNSGGEVSSFCEQSAQHVYTYFEELPRYKQFLCDLKDEFHTNCDIAEKIDSICKTLPNELSIKLLALKKKVDISKIDYLINAVNRLGDFSGHREFLEKFHLFTSQADEQEIEEVIKSEIQAMCMTTEVESAAIYKELIENIQKWWKYDNFYLSDSTPFWEDIIKTRKDHISSVNNIKIQELSRLGIKYNSFATSDIKDVLRANSFVNIIADGEATLLSCLKVYQVLEDEGSGYLLVGTETLLHHLKDILSLWPSKWCQNLVVEFDSFLQNPGKIWTLMSNILEPHKHKKIIIVSTTPDKVSCKMFKMKIQENFVQYVDKFSFRQLSNESQKALLRKIVVEFQGFPVNLNSLFDNSASLTDAINVNVFSQLLSNDYNLKVGEQLGDQIDYYIPRVMESFQFINTTILAINSIDFPDVIAISGYTTKELIRHVPKGTQIETLQTVDELIMDFQALHTQDIAEVYTKVPSQNMSEPAEKKTPVQEMKIIKKKAVTYSADPITGRNEKSNQIKQRIVPVVRKPDISFDNNINIPVPETQSNSKCNNNPNSCCLFIINSEESFMKLCQIHKNVHWLTKHEDDGTETLRWLKSQGDVDIIYHHLNSSKKTVYYKVENVLSIQDRIILIIAEAGMGKSTLFSHLAVVTKESNPNMWVIRVNLNDHTTYLDKVDPTECNVDEVFQFLCLAANVESFLEKRLLEHYLKVTGNLVILLDGYDEISPTHAHKAGAILQCLCESKVKKILVSSRPIMKTFLEKMLSAFAFTLQPFSVEDQQNFLLNFWRSRLPNINSSIEAFAKKLLTVSSRFFDSQFMGVPLQTMMLAEAYGNCISKDQISELSENLDLLHLYEKFVDKKIEIYCIQKKKMDITKASVKNDNEYWHNLFLENHILAAMTTLFSPSEYIQWFSSDMKSKMDEFVSKIQQGHEKTGIINNVSDGKPQFIHRTFADYFVGKFLSFQFQSSDSNNSIHQSIMRYFTNKLFSYEQTTFTHPIYETIFDQDFDVVRNIFDRSLARNFQLHSAIISQDSSSVQKLIANGINVNSRDKGGRTPLHLAASYSTTSCKANSESNTGDLIVQLLNNGADINSVDNILQWRPLHYADRTKAWDTIENLLQNNAAVEDLISTKQQASMGKQRQNVLYIVASKGYVKLLQFIMQIKYSSVEDHHQYDRYEKYMLLRTAVTAEQWEIVRFLVQNHIDINVKHGEGDSILHWASRQGKPEAISHLVKLGADINIRNKYGNTPLHCAAKNGSLSVVTTIVELGGNVSAVNNEGNTALYQAAGQGMWHVVNHLLHLGSNINIGSSLGNTPLHWAAGKDEAGIIYQLVQSHADINICNNNGNTPLHWAVWKGNEKTIEVIVQLGAFIDVRNSLGETPVYWAAKQSNWTKVDKLIDLGADVNIRNNKGNVPLHWAAKYGNSDIVSKLAKYTYINIKNHYGNTPLHFAAGNGKCELITFFMQAGAEINAQNATGNTPLHWATGENQQDAVRLLVQLGADLRVRNVDGNAAIHIAAGQDKKEADNRFLGINMDLMSGNSRNKLVYRFYGDDNVDMVRLLVGLDCNVNALNKKKNTALHCAAWMGNVKVVRYLVQLNVRRNARNRLGMTPLDLAFKNRKARKEIIDILTSKGALRGNLLTRYIPV